MKYENNINSNQNLNEKENLIAFGSNINRFAKLNRVAKNISGCNLDNKNMLSKVTMKIGLERINK